MDRLSPNMSPFSKEIKICNHNVATSINANNYLSKADDSPGVFKLQTISIGGHRFNLFYDGGCGDLVCKKSAVDKLIALGRAKQELPGPFLLTGVGEMKKVCENGIYQVSLPLADGGMPS